MLKKFLHLLLIANMAFPAFAAPVLRDNYDSNKDPDRNHSFLAAESFFILAISDLTVRDLKKASSTETSPLLTLTEINEYNNEHLKAYSLEPDVHFNRPVIFFKYAVSQNTADG